MILWFVSVQKHYANINRKFTKTPCYCLYSIAKEEHAEIDLASVRQGGDAMEGLQRQQHVTWARHQRNITGQLHRCYFSFYL